ncbi:F0F1 ATP synthase subunit B' [Candidatus Cyanaurora vandensis]|uniref:F0F1 ATP synthase subunit B' n=1 Tax=Candidatus Cyanaurora vandensis TaxID=2714958 RepID=UPI00257F64D3|nr:F0F1 ATP synthase subunit B' [Candidatus Cyanaurora vandensis]
MVLEGFLLLAAETVGEAVYPRGPLCPSGLLCVNGTLFFQAINFFVFVIIINVILLKPIQRVTEERENYILTNRNEAQQRLAEAKRLADQYEAELVDTRREAQEIIAKAEAEAMTIRTQKLAEVQQEAAARLEQSRLEVQAAKETALAGLQQEVVKLSAQITAKLLATSPR